MAEKKDKDRSQDTLYNPSGESNTHITCQMKPFQDSLESASTYLSKLEETLNDVETPREEIESQFDDLRSLGRELGRYRRRVDELVGIATPKNSPGYSPPSRFGIPSVMVSIGFYNISHRAVIAKVRILGGIDNQVAATMIFDRYGGGYVRYDEGEAVYGLIDKRQLKKLNRWWKRIPHEVLDS